MTDITIGPGERVTCENGHFIAAVVETINQGDRTWAHKVGRWQIQEPAFGSRAEACVCPHCGARWFRGAPPALHIEGRGYVPPQWPALPPMPRRFLALRWVLRKLGYFKPRSEPCDE